MPATGYTPILLYGSANAGATPAAANLTNGTGGSEIAINITDGRLYYKDDNGVVQLIGAKLNSVLAAALASAPVGSGSVVLASGVTGTGNVVLASGTVGTGNVVLASGTVGTGAAVLSSALASYMPLTQGIVARGSVAYAVSTTLTAANAGQIIFFTGTAASTFTLPASASAAAYAMKLTISNAGGAPLTITPAAGDSYDLQTHVLQSGQQVILVNDGGTYWHVIAQNNGTTLPFAVGAAQTSTQAVNLGQMIGGGATQYANVTGSRALSATYTNTTGRPLVVCVVGEALVNLSALCELNGYVDGNLSMVSSIVNSTGSASTTFYPSIMLIVPPGGTYSASASTSVIILKWLEY